MERRGGTALAQFRRHCWRGYFQPVRLSVLYRFADRSFIRNRLRWHNRPTGWFRLDGRCFGSLDRGAIVRHDRISRLVVHRGLPPQSWIVFHAALRCWSLLSRFLFQSASGRSPGLCCNWIYRWSSFLRRGIAISAPDAMVFSDAETNSLVELATHTVMGINK